MPAGGDAVTAAGSVAMAYLDATHAARSAEHAVETTLIDFMGEEHDFDMTCDPYDGSLELFSQTLPEDRVAEVGAFILSLGFDRCWVHLHGGSGECRQVRAKCARQWFFLAERP